MKKIVNLLVVVLFATFFLSCSQAQTKQKQNTPAQKAKLEVLYFHATNRCPTCNAIENNAKKLLEETYKTQMDKGIIKFVSYNIDESANKALVEKYQISFSTLLLIKSDGTKTDFTDKAFQYARTKPEKYSELLKAEIEKQLAN